MTITDTDLPDADFDLDIDDDGDWSLDDEHTDDWMLLHAARAADRDAIEC